MPIAASLTRQSFDTRWTSLRRAYPLLAPRPWQSWLMDRGSLTQRLLKLSQGEFRVEKVRQSWGRPTRSEAKALHMRDRQCALIREVQLLGHNQPWVYARSVIPAQTLTGAQRRLRRLGNQSLGSLLFRAPSMRRGPLQICRLNVAGESFWARRSLFYLAGKPLLVCEVFLPALQQVH